MLPHESLCRLRIAIHVMFEFSFYLRAGFKEINRSVLAVLVSSRRHPRNIFPNGGSHRPHERMNWAKYEDRCLPIPTCGAQRLLRVLLWMRLKCPCGIGSKFVGHAQAA